MGAGKEVGGREGVREGGWSGRRSGSRERGTGEGGEGKAGVLAGGWGRRRGKGGEGEEKGEEKCEGQGSTGEGEKDGGRERGEKREKVGRGGCRKVGKSEFSNSVFEKLQLSNSKLESFLFSAGN